MMAPPAGYTPMGYILIFNFVMFFWDVVPDVLQMKTFFFHGDLGFTAAMAFFVCVAMILQVLAWLSEGGGWPWTNLQAGLRRGLPTVAWCWVVLVERQVEAPGTGLVGPYGSSLIEDLEPTAALAAVVGLLLSVKSMGGAAHDEDFGGAGEPTEAPAGKIVAKEAYTVLLPLVAAGRTAGVLGGLATFSVACRVWHPALVYPIFAGDGMCVGRAAGDTSWVDIGGASVASGVASILSPLSFFTAFRVSAFGLMEVSRAGWPYMAWALLRLVVFGASLGLDVPGGLLPWRTLGRPKGYGAFEEAFLTPVAAVLASGQACLAGSCAFVPAEGLTAGSTLQRAMLLVFAIFGSLVEFVFHVTALLLLPYYVYGGTDEELVRKKDAKKEEIDQYTAEREGGEIRYGMLGVELVEAGNASAEVQEEESDDEHA